jgi:membrane associated rhomboid family serine protease
MFPLRDTNQTYGRSIITWIIILFNCLAFANELMLQPNQMDEFFQTYGVVPAVLTSGFTIEHFGSIFSSMFLHNGWAHILGNMWFLFIFGDNVEHYLGHVKYLIFYLFAGMCAAFTQVLVSPHSQLPMVGASGAISGVLGAYLVLFPQARVTTLMPLGVYSRIVELPALTYLGIWFLMQIGGQALEIGAWQKDVGGVAFMAHVGGFLAGLIVGALTRRTEDTQY